MTQEESNADDNVAIARAAYEAKPGAFLKKMGVEIQKLKGT